MPRETGKALVANTALRRDEILERVGYTDDSAFRRLFRKHAARRAATGAASA